jgi:NTP pyrophosphatase (non-canonical NTP hydrolase)
VDDKTWTVVEHQSAWLDTVPGVAAETRVLSQILKVTEEAGEVAEAVIGATGQNPRKGFSHSWDDVAVELCDVVISALVALNRVAPDARRVFAERVEFVYQRSVAAGAAELREGGAGGA